MGQRLELQTLLEAITPHVYFQPPANIQMEYPCFVYRRFDIQPVFANNDPYRLTVRYQLTVIDRDPDSTLPGQVAALPLCRYVRFFATQGLNHDVFNLFF